MSVGLWGAGSVGVNLGCFGMSGKEIMFSVSLVIMLSLQLARMEKSPSQLLMGVPTGMALPHAVGPTFC